MKIAIVGSRGFKDYKNLYAFIDKNVDIREIDLIISGGAIGADFLGERFALEIDRETNIFRPDWKRYGKRAGLLRNDMIVEAADIVFAFWDGKSRGTAYTIAAARHAGTELHVFHCEG